MVKAQNFALQVLGIVLTVLLDQVDGAQIYFSKESTGTKLFTSKSDGINLNVISGPYDDYKEVALPCQICSYYDEAKGELVNEIGTRWRLTWTGQTGRGGAGDAGDIAKTLVGLAPTDRETGLSARALHTEAHGMLGCALSSRGMAR